MHSISGACAKSRDLALAAPDHSDAKDAPVVVYARPHEIEIDRYSPGQPGLRVQFVRAVLIGGAARLELEREDNGGLIEAEIPADLYRKLKLRDGESLIARPGKMQVFLEQSSHFFTQPA